MRKTKKRFFIMASFSVVKAFIFTVEKILRLPIHTHKLLKWYNKKREMNKHFHFFISAWYTRYVGCKKTFFEEGKWKCLWENEAYGEYGKSSRSLFNCVSRALSSSFTISIVEKIILCRWTIKETTYIMAGGGNIKQQKKQSHSYHILFYFIFHAFLD